jgi:hypothetical protein
VPEDMGADRRGRASVRGHEAVSWGPDRSIKIGQRGVRTVRSRSDGGNQTGKDKLLRVTLTGGSGRQVCVREAVPAVRAVRSSSDRGG